MLAVDFTIGANPEEAIEYLVESGPGRLIVESIPEGERRDAALADVRAAVAGFTDDRGVHLGGGSWIVRPTR